jgi:hypothetical protein
MKLRKFAVVIALTAMGSFAIVSSSWAAHCSGDVDGDGKKDGDGTFPADCEDHCNDNIDADGDGTTDGGFVGPGAQDCSDTCDGRLVAAGGTGVDTDGDDVPDCVDLCPGSNVDPTVAVGACNKNVPNSVDTTDTPGCTINDQVGSCLADFAGNQCKACVQGVSQDAFDEGRISAKQKTKINKCAKDQC